MTAAPLLLRGRKWLGIRYAGLVRQQPLDPKKDAIPSRCRGVNSEHFRRLPTGYAATMIQLKTMLSCIDNSGAAMVECVQVMKMKRHAKIGDRIIVVVQKQRNFSESGPGASVGTSAANKVKRGDLRHAVVVRTKKKLQRPDGSVVRFDDNACVLINKAGEPIGTRLNGVVGTELRKMKWSKILSLAPMHL